jgi:phosphoglycolate phosphatase-like HAD superfamily hydrolase
MADIFELFPGDKGLLEKPITIDGTDGAIEIIREFDGSQLSVGLFDFDGTLSDERLGWPDLMVSSNAAFLVALSNPHIEHTTAQRMVIEDIESTIGIPTYMQMKRLRTMIEKHGYDGPEINPRLFKDVFNDALVSMVESRREKLRSGEFTVDDLRISGGLELLQSLGDLVTDGVYLASGSDVDAVRESVVALGYAPFFPPERIAGAGTLGPEDDAKEAVIKKLLTEHGLSGNQVVTFGDGFPEILHTHLAGGVAVGVLTYDHSIYEHLGHFTLEQKEDRLRRAGAHIIVRNPFSHIPELIEAIKQGYKALKDISRK